MYNPFWVCKSVGISLKFNYDPNLGVFHCSVGIWLERIFRIFRIFNGNVFKLKSVVNRWHANGINVASMKCPAHCYHQILPLNIFKILVFCFMIHLARFAYWIVTSDYHIVWTHITYRLLTISIVIFYGGYYVRVRMLLNKLKFSFWWQFISIIWNNLVAFDLYYEQTISRLLYCFHSILFAYR